MATPPARDFEKKKGSRVRRSIGRPNLLQMLVQRWSSEKVALTTFGDVFAARAFELEAIEEGGSACDIDRSAVGVLEVPKGCDVSGCCPRCSMHDMEVCVCRSDVGVLEIPKDCEVSGCCLCCCCRICGCRCTNSVGVPEGMVDCHSNWAGVFRCDACGCSMRDVEVGMCCPGFGFPIKLKDCDDSRCCAACCC
jgi:hypothetical protein